MTETNSTLPAVDQKQDAAAPHIVLAPYYRDPANGAVYVHKDLELAVEPWADAERIEDHLAPVRAAEAFGDVESFAAYVTRYGFSTVTLVTWNAMGLRAVLDYHEIDHKPGRCQWTATHGFMTARPLQRWADVANGSARGQKELVEFLEDMADTIIAPPAADVIGILSTLRASVGSKADSTLNEDGSYSVQFSKEGKVTAKGTIPATFTISVPLLHGHIGTDGRAVNYDLTVRLRVTPTEAGAQFRLSIPNLADALENAWADRVEAARAALGSEYPILRAADPK